MGILSGIFGKKDVATDLTKQAPYKLSSEWTPYKLYSGRKSSALLNVRVRNMTNEVLLTSVVAELPKQLGFEAMKLSSQMEKRVGEIAPQEEKEIRFEVFSGVNSDKGQYTVNLTTFAHYRDYGHVLNYVKKKITIDVV